MKELAKHISSNGLKPTLLTSGPIPHFFNHTMSLSAPTNGPDSSQLKSLSFAEKLALKHSGNVHVPTIEDAVDEEDIAHPPPSSMLSSQTPETGPGPILVESQVPLSEKALGKQKAQDESHAAKGPTKRTQEPLLDTKSEELFPALGGGIKSPASGSIATAWGTKKPASVANGTSNGLNGYGPASSVASSRASTPASNGKMPASANALASGNAAARTNASQHMIIPGKHVENVQFAPSQLLQRKDLKKPILEVLRDINKRSKATVEMKTGPGGVTNFIGTGPVDAVRQALKDVASQVGSKVCVLIVRSYKIADSRPASY